MEHGRHRHSIRLPDYDYAQPAAYFVTLCGHPTFTSDHPFSEVTDDTVTLTSVGAVIEAEWLHTAEMRRAVMIDAYIIMPTHLHGVLILAEDASARSGPPQASGSAVVHHGPSSGTIGAILAGFKSAVTSRVRREMGVSDIQVWQRNYFEHVVRNQHVLAKVQEYITTNPPRWTLDRYNPKRTGSDEFGQALWQLLKEQTHP